MNQLMGSRRFMQCSSLPPNLLYAAPDDVRFVQPELDGPAEWIMAYNKPTSSQA